MAIDIAIAIAIAISSSSTVTTTTAIDAAAVVPSASPSPGGGCQCRHSRRGPRQHGHSGEGDADAVRLLGGVAEVDGGALEPRLRARPVGGALLLGRPEGEHFEGAVLGAQHVPQEACHGALVAPAAAVRPGEGPRHEVRVRRQAHEAAERQAAEQRHGL